MKRQLKGTLIVLGLGWTLGQASTAFAEETKSLDAAAAPAYEEVDSFSALGGLSDFDALDNKTLIVWSNPFRPYLVELAYPSVDLRFAHAIAIPSTAGRIYSGFDSVLIKGFRYPIRNIYKLTREEAKELRRRA